MRRARPVLLGFIAGLYLADVLGWGPPLGVSLAIYVGLIALNVWILVDELRP